jgi:hypothetical protein
MLVTQKMQPLTLVKRQIDSYADHYGVFLGEIKGQYVVFEFTSDRETDKAYYRVSTMQEFASDREVQSVLCERSSTGEIEKRMREVIRRVDNGELSYSMSGSAGGWNCEQAARYILTGSARSIQLEAEKSTHGLQKATVVAGALSVGGFVLGVTGLIGVTIFSLLTEDRYQSEKDCREKDCGGTPKRGD